MAEKYANLPLLLGYDRLPGTPVFGRSHSAIDTSSKLYKDARCPKFSGQSFSDNVRHFVIFAKRGFADLDHELVFHPKSDFTDLAECTS